jgi:uncharacterized protein with NAD-binding domain and iron-sulfur cluster
VSDRPPRRVAVLGGGAAGLSAAWQLTDPALDSRFEVTVYTLGWRLGGKGASARDHGRILEHGLHVWFGFYDASFELVHDVYAQLGRDATDAFRPIRACGLWDADRKRWWTLPLPVDAKPSNERGPVAVVASWLYAMLRELADEDDPPEALAAAAGRPPPRSHTEHGEQMGLLRNAVEELASGVLRDLARFWAQLLDAAVAEGLLLLPLEINDDAFADLDGQEWSDWLAQRVDPELLDAPFVGALYDLAFGYAGGDPAKRSLAAGMATRNLFRIMFEHHGTLAYYLTDGMGDVVFAPLYRALRDRGVRFEFFCAVQTLRPAPGERRIDAIDVARQVKVRGGSYDPLVDGGWPAQPKWADLDGADPAVDYERDLHGAPFTLRRGEHFDDVVLAIPVGALPAICQELVDEDAPTFGRMIEDSATVRTQAVQLWLDDDPARYGLTSHRGGLAGAYPKPLDTCADMSHLLERERWPAGSGVRGLAYLCSVLEDDAADPLARVRANADRFVAARGLDGHVVDRYVRANVSPSERYVLSPPGRIRSRLAPGETRWTNLALAGDWTRTVINAGSFEAAVRSGREAARVLARPRYADFGGLRSVPAPLLCSQANVHYFWVGADRAKVLALCRRVFDEPTGGDVRVEPLLDHVAISFGTMKVVAQVPPYDRFGFVWERHAAVWVPVRATGVEGAPELGAFLSNVWVDNPMSIAVGHDVFGYPKNLAQLRFEGLDPAEYALDSYAIKLLNGRDQPQLQPLVQITRNGAAAGDGIEIGDVLDALGAVSRMLGLSGRGLASHLRLGIPQLFLRQFRAPEGGFAASGQQVVLARSYVKPGTLRLTELGEHAVTVHPVQSEALEADLGLASGVTAAAVRVQMDFHVLPGQVLWESGS